jgi:hypothetical protein
MDGRAIYDNFHQGQGGEQLATAATSLVKAHDKYDNLAVDIRTLTAEMDALWEGDAGGAARRGAGPLVVEHELAKPELHTAQDLTVRQVGSFDRAKAAVQPVPDKPEEPGFWDNVNPWSDAEDDFERDLQKHNGANDANVQVMRAYESDSTYNETGMPTSYGNLAPDQSAIVVGPEPGDPGTGRPGQRWVPPSNPGENGSNPPGSSGIGNPPGSSPGYQPPGSTNPSGAAPPGGWGSSQQPGYGTGPGYQSPGTSASSAYPTNSYPPGTYPPGTSYPPGTYPPGTGPDGRGPNSGGQGGYPGTGGSGPYGTGTGGSGGGSGAGGGGGARGGGGSGGYGSGGSGAGSGAGGTGAGARSGAGAGAGGFGAGGGFGDEGHGNQNRAGAGAGGRGGAGMGGGGGGGRGQGGEDEEHQTASYLLENDPDSIFGSDEITAPPVIGG